MRGIVGTVAYDAAEVGFHLPEDSESDAKLPLLSLYLRIEATGWGTSRLQACAWRQILVTENTGDESAHNLNANKTTSNARRMGRSQGHRIGND